MPEELDEYEQSYRAEFVIFFFVKKEFGTLLKLINGSKVLWTKMSDQ